MTNTEQDLRTLDGMHGEPITVVLAGQTYLMGMLEPGDFVACAAERARDRLKLIFDTHPSNIAQDVETIKAKMGAEVLSKPCGAWDLLGDVEGVCRLAACALTRGGQFKGNYLGLMSNPTKYPYKELEQAVFRASGFHLVKAAQDKDAVSKNPQ